MEDTEILEAFSRLLLDLNDVYILEQERPLLAHYTSMAVSGENPEDWGDFWF